jgi:glyoxylase-like metal-dependent hydrolase (beta-lactamase superfamily II)
VGRQPVHVRTFTTGRVRPKRASRGARRYLPGGWSGDTLPVHAFLVDHPAGLCLFDTGQSHRAAAAGYLPRWHPFLRLARFELSAADEVGAQLRAAGIEPGSVRWVVLSHLHTDHVGGIEDFAGAEIVVSRVEWERAQGLAGRVRGYVPQHWPPDLRPRLVEPAGPTLGPFAWSLDLSDDGSLIVVPTPGHTPGHLALVARDGSGGVFLGGDVAHSAEELVQAAPGIARFCDAEQLTVLLAHEELP